MKTLDPRSERNLKGVHPDLVRIVRVAAGNCPTPFMCIEGVRTLARQKQLIAQGFSQLKDPASSRHVPSNNWAHAVDLVPINEKGQPHWPNTAAPAWKAISGAMLEAARTLGTPLTWGGNWKTFKDMPHYELPKSKYP
jgi:peptidoglycan L-alanyl-D-glutamate endopeptidase CwlK